RCPPPQLPPPNYARHSVKCETVASASMKLLRIFGCLLIIAGGAAAADKGKDKDHPASLELTRPGRTWGFFSARRTRAGIFGHRSRGPEGWVFPLKIFRDFHLRFHTEDRALPAESLARTVIVRPAATTIVNTSDTFSVRVTLVV